MPVVPSPDRRPYHALTRAQRWLGYHLLRGVTRVIAPLIARRDRRGFDAWHPGPCLLIANHISHFDAAGLVWCSPRKVDILASAELYESRWLSLLLRCVDCVSVDRGARLSFDGPAPEVAAKPIDLRAVQRMTERLARGRTLAVFPEGGIRTGARSLLEGADYGAAPASLAIRCRVPLRPLLILGTDQLYVGRRWFTRGARVVYWLGEPLWPDPALRGVPQRDELMARCSSHLRALYAEALATLPEPAQLRPRTAQAHWAEAAQ